MFAANVRIATASTPVQLIAISYVIIVLPSHTKGAWSAAVVISYATRELLYGHCPGAVSEYVLSMDRTEKGVAKMNIIVCVKQIMDPELPPAKFRLDAEGKRVLSPEGIPPVINPYDEQAVELAIRLKEKYEGRITIVSLGSESATKAVKHALSMGADEGIIITDDVFEGSDNFATAYILSQAIQKFGDYDLVLCGRQAADWDEGIVGSIIAANLTVPLVTMAHEIDVVDGELHVKRATLDGYQVYAVPTPALATVSHEVGKPRLPSGWGIIAAAKKEVPVWNANDIGIDPSQVGTNAARRTLVKLFIPDRERKCEIIEGEDGQEAAENLAAKLREAGVI